jgi:cell volume regulation protein A
MVKRGGRYFVPKGRTELFDGDHLLIITDDKNLLMKTLSASGIGFNNAQTYYPSCPSPRAAQS